MDYDLIDISFQVSWLENQVKQDLSKTSYIFPSVTRSFKWEKAVKKTHMFPPDNCIATRTKGEKDMKFLLKNNLLIRVV